MIIVTREKDFMKETPFCIDFQVKKEIEIWEILTEKSLKFSEIF